MLNKRPNFFFLFFFLFLIAPEHTGAGQNLFDIISDAQYKAAARFHVPVELLDAIKQVESRGYPWALNVNLGTGKSVPIYPGTYEEAAYYLSQLTTENIDIGPWQVNYRYIGKRMGMTKTQMLNPYVSSLLAAYKLSNEIATNGYTWNAVGNYHSYNLQRKIKYVLSVKRQLAKDAFKVRR